MAPFDGAIFLLGGAREPGKRRQAENSIRTAANTSWRPLSFLKVRACRQEWTLVFCTPVASSPDACISPAGVSAPNAIGMPPVLFQRLAMKRARALQYHSRHLG